jgi:hypothetical protein
MREETRLQREIRKLLALKGYRSVACSNGAVLAGDGRARAIQMNTLKSAGLTPGYPDQIVYGPHGKVGHLEVKLEGEQLTDKQVEVHAWLRAWGQKVAVCRSLEDVGETLAGWGW